MKTGKGLLAVWMEPRPELEDDLNRWYEQEHLAERMAIPGFLGVRRYTAVEGGPKYVAFYELDNHEVLQSEPYLKAMSNSTPWTRRVVDNLQQSVRNVYELVSSRGESGSAEAPYLLMVRLEVDDEHDAELNRWYEEEHLDALMSVPGCHAARRYRAVHGSPRYLAVYEVESAELPSSEVWQNAASTGWTLRMRPLFRNYARSVGRLIASMP